jgi:hypothetical protein
VKPGGGLSLITPVTPGGGVEKTGFQRQDAKEPRSQEEKNLALRAKIGGAKRNS